MAHEKRSHIVLKGPVEDPYESPLQQGYSEEFFSFNDDHKHVDDENKSSRASSSEIHSSEDSHLGSHISLATSPRVGRRSRGNTVSGGGPPSYVSSRKHSLVSSSTASVPMKILNAELNKLQQRVCMTIFSLRMMTNSRTSRRCRNLVRRWLELVPSTSYHHETICSFLNA